MYIKHKNLIIKYIECISEAHYVEILTFYDMYAI